MVLFVSNGDLESGKTAWELTENDEVRQMLRKAVDPSRTRPAEGEEQSQATTGAQIMDDGL